MELPPNCDGPDGLCAIGAPEVRENGEWLAGLEGVPITKWRAGRCGSVAFVECQQSLVRRVLRVAENLAIGLCSKSTGWATRENAQLESSAGGVPHEAARVERQQFSSRLRRILTDHFPDETVGVAGDPATCTIHSGSLHSRPRPPRFRKLCCDGGHHPMKMPATIDGI